MVTAYSTNLFIFFWQSSQVLSGHFIKRNLANGSIHLVKYVNFTKTVYILSRHKPLRRKLSKVDFFKGGSSDICKKSTALFLKLII